MQILEVTEMGVRSAVLRLRRVGSPLEFRVFPMVHIGDPAFYAAVTERLRGCDLILAEGIGPSAAVTAITSSYRIPAALQRSGLVEQHIPYREIGVPVINPDLTGEEFADGFRRLPPWQKAFVATTMPLVGLGLAAFGSRRALARHLELTDVDFYDNRLFDVETAEELTRLLGDKRDRRLMLEMHRLHEQRRREQIVVAVVYGANHVTPVVHGLRGLHGYSVQTAEWLTVFEI